MNLDKRMKLVSDRLKTSDRLRSYLSLKAKEVHREFGLPDVPVIIENVNDPSFVAYTDNRSYHINVGNPDFYKDCTEEDAFRLRLGLLAHEIGHRLFTCFTASTTWYSSICSGTFYPEEPKVSKKDMVYLDEIKTVIQDEKLAKLLAGSVGLNLSNCLEDGRIEELILDYLTKHKSLYDGLVFARRRTYLRGASFKENLECYEKEEPNAKLSAILNLILFYSRFTEIKTLEEEDEETELYKLFDVIEPCLDEYLAARTQIELCRAMNNVIIAIWPHIRDLFKMEDKDEKDSESGNGPKSSEAPGSPGSGQATGNSSAAAPPSLTEEELEELKKLLEELFGALPSSETPDLSSSGTDNAGNPANPMYTQTDSITTNGSGVWTYEEAEMESQTKLELSSLLRKIGEEIEDEEKENTLVKDIQSFAKSIDFPNIHRNVDCNVILQKITDENRRQYEYIAQPLKKIAKSMARKSTFLQEEQEDFEIRNRYCGSSLSPSSFAREDYRVFKKNVHVEPENSLSVGVLIDESGSMWGDREEAAKRAAILLYEYCDAMDIPISIYGHSTSWGVALFPYTEYGSKSKDDRYRLMNISARSSNRDGFALRFMMERLKRQETLDKLLFIISDGQPADSGYGGSAAAKDLSIIVKECDDAGIFLIAAAIGSDKPTIKGIYGANHFLDISDLGKLPEAMLKLLRKRIKK